MTAPDTPDWIAGSTSLTVIRSLFTTGAQSSTANANYSVANLQPWASLTLLVQLANNLATATQPVAVMVNWFSGGTILSSRQYVLSPLAVGNAANYAIKVPVEGDTVQVNVNPTIGGAPAAYWLTVYGSSQALAAPRISTSSPPGTTAVLAIYNAVLNAGAAVSFELPPTTLGYSVNCAGLAGDINATLQAYTTGGAAWSLRRIGGALSSADPGGHIEVHTAFTACRLVVSNTSTVNTAPDVTVTEVAA